MKSVLRCAVVLCAIASMANAGVIFPFQRITSNTPDGWVPSFTLEVSEYGNGVLFTFSNLGPYDGSIMAAYFDDTTYLTNGDVLPTTGVDFHMEGEQISFGPKPKYNSVSPGDLPGGNTVGFTANPALSSDADGNPSNGVNPGETLDIAFELLTGDYDDVIAAIRAQTLVAGIHVQDLGPDGQFSDSFTVHAPVPGALVLGGIGVVATAFMRRRLS